MALATPDWWLRRTRIFNLRVSDVDELEYMDENERREALEDAGLDPDDYDDF